MPDEEKSLLQSISQRASNRSDGRSSNKLTKSSIRRSSTFAKSNERLELTFRDLDYLVELEKKFRKPGGPKEKKILSGVTGVFRPGRLTAIMGSSGAGKTTLLSVLAGNARNGVIDGNILVNGVPFTEKMLKDISGFVFQDDVLLPTMKVGEAISMSASLRLPKSVTKEEREMRIEEVLELMHLENARDTKVGSPLEKGISGGERKRTAIGMEMVTNPAMLFLDEPTTGLDTFTAFTVIFSLKGLAKQGRTVVATIHQPSTEIFSLFDDLLVLSRGKVAYCGPVKRVIPYLSRNGYQCPRYSNPADYLFMQVLREFGGLADEDEDEEEKKDNDVSTATATATVTAASNGNTSSTSNDPSSSARPNNDGSDDNNNNNETIVPDTASERRAAGTGQVAATMGANLETSDSQTPRDSHPKTAQERCDERIEALLGAWKESPEQKALYERCTNRPPVGVSNSLIRRKAPFWFQFGFLMQRATKNLVRNTPLMGARLFQSVFIGLVVGLVYIKTRDFSIPVQIRNKSGALYFISVNLFFAAASQILAIFSEEKQVFYREFHGGYYNIGPYYISKTLVEIPAQVIGPYLMVLICYYMIGLSSPFSDYLMVATLGALAALCGNAYGTLISALVDDVSLALAIGPMCILPFIIVSGIFVGALPVYINWLKYISPVYYSFSGMIGVQFDSTIPDCDPAREPCTPEQVDASLNFFPTFSPGVDVVFLVTIFCVLWIAGFIALYIGAKRRY